MERGCCDIGQAAHTRLLSNPVEAYLTTLSYAAKLQDLINAWSFEHMVLRTLDLETPHLQ